MSPIINRYIHNHSNKASLTKRWVTEITPRRIRKKDKWKVYVYNRNNVHLSFLRPWKLESKIRLQILLTIGKKYSLAHSPDYKWSGRTKTWETWVSRSMEPYIRNSQVSSSFSSWFIEAIYYYNGFTYNYIAIPGTSYFSTLNYKSEVLMPVEQEIIKCHFSKYPGEFERNDNIHQKNLNSTSKIIRQNKSFVVTKYIEIIYYECTKMLFCIC